MNPSRRALKLLIPAVLLLLPALVLRSSLKDPERLKSARSPAVAESPLRCRAWSVAGWAGRRRVVAPIALVGVKRDNEKLSADNAALRARVEPVAACRPRRAPRTPAGATRPDPG